jgi:hypothetical protein
MGAEEDDGLSQSFLRWWLTTPSDPAYAWRRRVQRFVVGVLGVAVMCGLILAVWGAKWGVFA